MKKLLLSLSSLSILSGSYCLGQHTWPPGGTQPSPYTSNLKLPGGRYLASTNTYNLVFADQLIPDNFSQAQINFIAQNYLGSQKIWAYQVAQYRAINPNFIAVSYHIANGINPQYNGDCPSFADGDGGTNNIGVATPPQVYGSEWENYFSPWLAVRHIAWGSTRYENMFQHYTQVDSNHRVWDGDPQWTMNRGNTDWQNYMDTTIEWMTGNQNEGMFFDDCVGIESEAGQTHPGSGDPTPYNFSWDQPPYGPVGGNVTSLGTFATWDNAQYISFFQSVYKAYHTPSVDYLIIPNVGQETTGWYDFTFLDGDNNGPTTDGVFTESWSEADYDEGDTYLELSRVIQHTTGPGKIWEVQEYDTTQAGRYRAIGMFMLCKNANSYINMFSGGPSLAPTWWPEYEINLGTQSQVPTDISSLVVQGSGSGSSAVFQRNYQYGMVLVNTTGSPYTYTLPSGTWYIVNTSGGGDVSANGAIAPQSITFSPAGSQVSVPSSEGGVQNCLILSNNIAAGIAETTAQTNYAKIYPNPASSQLSIEIPLGQIRILTVTDLLGRVVMKNTLNEPMNNLDISNVPQGLYVCTVTDLEGNNPNVCKLIVAH